MSKLGVALLGLDHWYAALDLAPTIASSAALRLVAIAHDDQAKARALANDTGAELATTDYRAALERDDIDIVVAMYSSDRNVEVCRAAAQAGKHILGVKPMALDRRGADAIVHAVREAGVLYVPFESSYRLSAHAQRIKHWIDEGRIGTPLRYTQSLHSSLPQAWPGASGSGWWIDPARVPGGAWIDHAIYAVDLARWIFGSEVVSAVGVIANRRHRDLALEDYGLATLELDNGVVAVIEDTWTAERGFSMYRSEFIGSAGAILDDSRTTGRLGLRGDFGYDSWIALEQQKTTHGNMVEHLADCVRHSAEPVATVEDARANLEACLMFYAAARAGRSPQPA